MNMQIYQGQGVFDGIAIGKIKLYKKHALSVNNVETEDVEVEILRFREAWLNAVEQLEQLREKMQKECGRGQASIFEAHQLVLQDEQYHEVVETMIRAQRLNAEYAVETAGRALARTFANMDSEYMQAREADIKDITERLLSTLKGIDTGSFYMEEPVIIVAEELTPSETVQFDKEKILAFVTRGGSINSHVAILSRNMGIPSLIGTDIVIDDTIDGMLGIVDGESGVIYVEPDETTFESMRKKQLQKMTKKSQLQSLVGQETITRNGQSVKLFANIGSLQELEIAKKNDAEGIGLFRSEFIYLEKDNFPTEEEQFQIYKAVLESMKEKQVIIRTLDIGADKQCEYFGLAREDNPALGQRGIRISLNRPEIFKVQLRALLRASAYGNLAIMYPMIISVDEVHKIYAIVEEVKRELEKQGVAYGDFLQGIMIETPAAVMISEELAREVDFFSIGTNDLTQYTLALDRLNFKQDIYYDPHHPAIFRMIELVVQSAHKEGIPVGICGELAIDTTLTEKFLALGVDELSVAPGEILQVRQAVRQLG